jgi:hypothetical protein
MQKRNIYIMDLKYIPARFVMAFDNAKADETPFPPPDISSPKSNFANLSFINSISESKPIKN